MSRILYSLVIMLRWSKHNAMLPENGCSAVTEQQLDWWSVTILLADKMTSRSACFASNLVHLFKISGHFQFKIRIFSGELRCSDYCE